MWTSVLQETIAVRVESSSPDQPVSEPARGVTDVDPDVEQAIHAALAEEG